MHNDPKQVATRCLVKWHLQIEHGQVVQLKPKGFAKFNHFRPGGWRSTMKIQGPMVVVEGMIFLPLGWGGGADLLYMP